MRSSVAVAGPTVQRTGSRSFPIASASSVSRASWSSVSRKDAPTPESPRPGRNPVCDHWYLTKTCDRRNPVVRSSWDNVTSPTQGGLASLESPTTANAKAVGGQGGWHG